MAQQVCTAPLLQGYTVSGLPLAGGRHPGAPAAAGAEGPAGGDRRPEVRSSALLLGVQKGMFTTLPASLCCSCIQLWYVVLLPACCIGARWLMSQCVQRRAQAASSGCAAAGCLGRRGARGSGAACCIDPGIRTSLCACHMHSSAAAGCCHRAAGCTALQRCPLAVSCGHGNHLNEL